jgi:hypothetical protein
MDVVSPYPKCERVWNYITFVNHRKIEHLNH